MDLVPVCLNQVHFHVAFLYQATIQRTGSVAFQVCRLADPEVSPFYCIILDSFLLYSVSCLLCFQLCFYCIFMRILYTLAILILCLSADVHPWHTTDRLNR